MAGDQECRPSGAAGSPVNSTNSQTGWSAWRSTKTVPGGRGVSLDELPHPVMEATLLVHSNRAASHKETVRLHLGQLVRFSPVLQWSMSAGAELISTATAVQAEVAEAVQKVSRDNEAEAWSISKVEWGCQEFSVRFWFF